jgi:hypothetical protein
MTPRYHIYHRDTQLWEATTWVQKGMFSGCRSLTNWTSVRTLDMVVRIHLGFRAWNKAGNLTHIFSDLPPFIAEKGCTYGWHIGLESGCLNLPETYQVRLPLVETACRPALNRPSFSVTLNQGSDLSFLWATAKTMAS